MSADVLTLYLDMNIYSCDYLLTCDDRLVKQGHRLRDYGVLSVEVLNPVDFVQEA
jgi:hypothetical protein